MSNPATTFNDDTSYISWTEDLLTGHEKIDADHRHIFDIANRLEAEIEAAPEHSMVGEVLVELIEYTDEHFMREEELMQSIQYPGYREHKFEHDLLVNKVNKLHRQFMDGDTNSPTEVLEFLRKWLVHHIMNVDMLLVRSVRQVK